MIILTFVDLEHNGYNVKDVSVFNTFDEASAEMEKQYLDRCECEGVKDPMATDSMDYQFSKDSFAFIFGKYYWDIFYKEV